MGKPQRKKRTHKNIKDLKKKFRTRRKTKDLDEIHEDIEKTKTDLILHQKLDPDLPGQGQFFCIHCSRYFINEKSLIEHKRTKSHKKRVRLLKDKPYTQAEAELAAGMGSYNIQVTDRGKPFGNQNQIPKNTSNEMDTFSPVTSVNTTMEVMGGLNID